MKKIASLILIGFAATALFAQSDSKSEKKADSADSKSEVVKLTLDDAVNYALENSYKIKSNDIGQEIKARTKKYSWNTFLPTVQATGTLARSTEVNPSYASYGITDFGSEEEHWNVTGGISVGLNFSLAQIQNIRATKADYEAGKISWEENQNAITVGIKKLFYGLLIQQEKLNIDKKSLEDARQRYNQANTNFRNGAIPRIQMLQAQVSYENKKPEVEDSEREYLQTLDSFSLMIGMPLDTQIELEGTIEPIYVDVDTKELLEKYGGETLEIKKIQKEIEQQKLQLSALNLKSYTPALSINYSWSPAYTDGSVALPTGAGGKAFSFFSDIGKDEKWYDSGAFSLTLAWNLTDMLPFSANRQSAADLKASIALKEISLEEARENQKMEVKKAVDTLNQAREQINSATRTLEVAQENYDMSARSYRNGTMELLDLREAETQLNQTKLNVLNKKMSYISALMDLEKALNTGLTRPPAAAEGEKKE